VSVGSSLCCDLCDDCLEEVEIQSFQAEKMPCEKLQFRYVPLIQYVVQVRAADSVRRLRRHS
jgi:hypothetical protein